MTMRPMAEPIILLDLEADVNENCERRIDLVWWN
jgi:hypothetical protein